MGSALSGVHGAPQVLYHLHVGKQDEIVRPGLRPVTRQVGNDQLGGDTAGGGEVVRLSDRHRGYVDAGHVVTLLGEPDRVATVAARDVQRPTRS